MKHTTFIALLCGAALTASAQPGPGFALRFDGSGNYVAVPHTAALNAYPLTVMAWVQTSQTTGQQGLLNKYVANSLNGWNVFLLNGRLRAWFFVNNTRYVWDGSNGLDGGFVADGLWHHLAFTVDADGVALAAIQGLNQKLEARSQKLAAENAKLQEELKSIQTLLERLTAS